MASFFAELKRRNVYKEAVAYAVVAWLLIQAASILFPTYEAPPWVMKVFIAVVAAGFPIALVIAWAFELTPEGLKRTDETSPAEKRPSSRRNFVALIAGVALLAGGLLVFQLMRPRAASAPQAAGGTTNEKSIAVLPFASLSEDKANGYFADGIQDEILTRLSKIGSLKVISRTSTQQYGSRPGNLAEIAKQLGVAHILEGSVQKAGESVRVNVQLIKAATDSHLWAETYDRKLTDIFAVESEVAERIAASLRAKLTGEEKEAVNYVGTNIPAAYDAFLRAIALRNSQSRDDQERFIVYLREAVALDPNFAAAWADLAVAEGLKYLQGERTEAQKELSRRAAENALRLDPDHGNGHAAWGMYLYYCLGEYDQALAEMQKAREQSPSDPKALQAIALIKRRQGNLEESTQLLLEAAQVDPLNQDNWVNLAWTYRGMRRFTDARAMFDRALAIAPGDRDITVRRAENDAAEGNLAAAARAIDEVAPPFGSLGYRGHIEVLAAQRKYDEAIAKLLADLEKAATQPALPPGAVAHAHLALGQLYAKTGRAAEAQAALLQAEAELTAMREQGNEAPDARAAMIACHAALGRRQKVEREVAAHIARQAKDRWTGPLAEDDAARAFCVLGDHDRALSLLEKLMKQSYADCVTPALLRIDPIWDSVRDDPRFQKLAGTR
ncbi:MAG TPA: hypothetical protein VF683_03330 [Chthoniobacterales bacterium]